MRRSLLLVMSLLILATGAQADHEQKAALKAGDDLPGPFRPYNVTGKYGERTIKELGGKERAVDGQFHCLVCEHGLDPMVMVIVRNADLANPPEPLISLLKGLNAAVLKHRRARLGSFAVFVSDDLTEVVTDDVKRADLAGKLKSNVDRSAELNLGEYLPLALAGKKDLPNYTIDENANVIVVLYKDYRVVHTFTFSRDMGLTDDAVKSILNRVSEMVAGKK